MSELIVIGSGKVSLGKMTKIAPDVQFVFQSASTIEIGDYCVINPGVKFVCDGGDVYIGDWTSLHDRCLLLSTEGIRVGQHCWFGQHCVLDGTGGLTIGNGVRVGMYSQIWSHVAAGEQIEGCTLFGVRPVSIEDDVWLVGTCIVASGVTIGRRTVALIGSNITKSCPESCVIAGSPAARKEGLSFYRDVSQEEKWMMLLRWLEEIAVRHNLVLDVTQDCLAAVYKFEQPDWGVICFVRSARGREFASQTYAGATVCELETKRYEKKWTPIESLVLKVLAGNKARFYS